MTTVLNSIQRTRRLVYGSFRFDRNELASNISTTATSLTLTYDSRLVKGAVIGIDLEVMYVWAYDTASKTATVERAYEGSTAVAHTAGDLIEINPRFTQYAISEALQDSIRSWPDELYRVISGSVDVAAGASWVDLSSAFANAVRLIEARARRQPLVDVGSTVTTWDSFPRLRYSRLVHGMDTDWFAVEGMALSLGERILYPTEVRVLAAAPMDLSTWALATDLVSTVGLASSMLDLPPLEAAARLMVGEEITRSDRQHQPEPRTAEEVPANYSMQTVAALDRLAIKRRREEAQRLMSRYGWFQ